MFQFTHPRGVRRACNGAKRIRCWVSIHAPTRGATLYSLGRGHVMLVSIHAPTRGATQRGRKSGNYNTCVSIHAPTRGATVSPHLSALTFQFQFTHPRGVRHGLTNKQVSEFLFQFTHPRGVRLLLLLRLLHLFAFQFTHPRGVRRNEIGRAHV